MNTLRKMLVAAAISATMAVSTQSVADEDTIKMIEALKLEVAQHTGVTAGYDQKSGILTLFGFSDDPSAIRSLIKRIEALPNVSEVRSTVSFE